MCASLFISITTIGCFIETNATLYTTNVFAIIQATGERRATRASISERIAALRRERGLTQEQLGAMVGVSAQAVSKWETGGAPDVELLPRLADQLGVSIDALFGRSSQTKQDIQEQLIQWLGAQPSEQQIRALFQLLRNVIWPAAPEDFWPLLPGVLKPAGYYERCFITFPGSGTQWLRFKMLTDGGLMLGVVADQLPLYLLMPEPEDSYASELLPLEQYRTLFDALRKPGALEVLCYFAGKKEDTYATAAGIARRLGQEPQQTEKILQELAQIHLLFPRDLETEEGKSSAYQLNDQNALIPFLVFARWLLEKDEAWLLCLDLRKRAILKRREQKDENR